MFTQVPQAFIGLFQVSTTEGWVDFMYATADSRGPDMHPVYNSNYFAIVFFVCYMIAGYVFGVNLFVGVIVNNFHKIRVETKGDVTFLTPSQSECNPHRNKIFCITMFVNLSIF
jgi:hypothetical protein